MPVEVGSPLWWVKRLAKQLHDRRKTIERVHAYYDGEHPLTFASEKFQKAFGGLFREFSDNWCELVVDAVQERLRIEGFRVPSANGRNAADEEAGDQAAWDIWQRNQLDADSDLAHAEALIGGESYALVWGDDDDEPLITIESPLEMIVEKQPGSRRERAAALKVWVDDVDATRYATLYLPDGIYKFEARGTRGTDWKEREIVDETWPLENPFDVVPVVPLENKPRLLKPGVSEIKRVISLQDAANKILADMIVASEYQSFRQRWATGLEIPTDPKTNQPIEPFKAAVDRVWMVEDDNAKFGEFGEINLQGFVQAIEMIVQHIASQTRTPPHYFYMKGEFPSGETIKSAETGLVAKVRSKQRFFGESWEEVIRLAFAVRGDARADAVALETIWGDPESRSESEHVDAVLKMQALGIPNEMLWERVGLSPTQIRRAKKLLREQALLGETLLQEALRRGNRDAPADADDEDEDEPSVIGAA